MSAHAILSASASHRWLACPGSVRLTRDLPDTSSVYAEEGTRAHELAALCLSREWDTTALPAYAEAAEGEEWGLYPPEMRGHVQSYLELVRAIPGVRHVEMRVDFGLWAPGGFGTADALVVAERTAHVVDLKYGQGLRVEATANPQLMLYALGAYAAFDWLYGIDRWELIIHQPRLDHVDTWAIDTPELLAWGEALRPVAQQALGPDAPLVPGETQCRFCAIKATCRARAEGNQAVAREEFATPNPKPDTLSSAEIGILLPKLAELTRWAAEVEAHALAQAIAGHGIPGHKLVEGRSLRQWRDPAAVAAALRRLKYRESDYITKTLISIGAAEKLLGGAKTAAPILDPLTIKPPGKPTLVPEADKRPALSSASARDDFNQAA